MWRQQRRRLSGRWSRAGDLHDRRAHRRHDGRDVHRRRVDRHDGGRHHGEIDRRLHDHSTVFDGWVHDDAAVVVDRRLHDHSSARIG